MGHRIKMGNLNNQFKIQFINVFEPENCSLSLFHADEFIGVNQMTSFVEISLILDTFVGNCLVVVI